MGNEPNFCCDHDAELRLFQSQKKMTVSAEKESKQQKQQKMIPAARHQRIFARDDISIIDQLDIKSEAFKEDIAPIKVKQTTKIITDILTEKENINSNSTLESKRDSQDRDHKWLEYRFKELQHDKKTQRQIIRREIENQYRTKQSLKAKKKDKQEKVVPLQKMRRQKHYDFQFIVNYR